MSRKQLSALWWFLAGSSLAIGILGYRDVVGWLESTKQLDNEQVPAVVAFWALVLGGILLALANLVGSLVAGRARRRPWQEKIPEWPLGFLADREAEDTGRWDWKLFKLCEFVVGAIVPWLASLWHFLKLTEARVVNDAGAARGWFFQTHSSTTEDLRIGAANGDSYLPLVTPGVALFVLMFATLSLGWFAAKLWVRRFR